MTFEGIQLVINKRLSNHFFDSHSLLIGTTSQISAKFGSIFGGTNQVGSENFSHFLIDDFNHRGNISTNVNVQPWDNLKLKLNTQVINYLIIIHFF